MFWHYVSLFASSVQESFQGRLFRSLPPRVHIAVWVAAGMIILPVCVCVLNTLCFGAGVSLSICVCVCLHAAVPLLATRPLLLSTPCPPQRLHRQHGAFWLWVHCGPLWAAHCGPPTTLCAEFTELAG